MTQPLQEEASASVFGTKIPPPVAQAHSTWTRLRSDHAGVKSRHLARLERFVWHARRQIASGYLRYRIDNILTFLSIAAVSALYGDRTFFVRPREDHE